MDIVNFFNSRTLDLESLFSAENVSRDNTDYSGALNTLGDVLEKLVKTWWDICTFKHYLKESIIMRSLRWEVSPQDGLDDEYTEWLEFCNGVGLKLQKLVLKNVNFGKKDSRVGILFRPY